MRFRALPILLVTALSLTGCVSAREVPPPITDAALQTYLEKRLDAAWLNTGLDGIVQRPQSDPAALVENFRKSDEESGFAQCVGLAGLSALSFDEQNGGPSFWFSEGDKGEAAFQLALYSCFADNPSTFGIGDMMLTEEELAFLYQYYQEWIVPCLESKGYNVGQPPTWEEFSEQSFYVWVPYNAISPSVAEDPYGFGLSREQSLELVDQCGDPFPGMPYGEQYGF